MNGKIIIGFAVLVVSPALIASQSSVPQEPRSDWISQPKVELIASVAVGHVFRFDDRGYGTKPNLGIGIELPVRRGLRVGAEINRTFGLSPGAAECGSIYPAPDQPAYPCTGSAREGVDAATAASFTAGYYFGNARIQPYLLGGVGFLRTRQYSATYVVRTDHVELQENSASDTGAGITLGIGLRIAVARRLSVRPEFRFYDGTALSRVNMSKIRFSAGLGYSW